MRDANRLDISRHLEDLDELQTRGSWAILARRGEEEGTLGPMSYRRARRAMAEPQAKQYDARLVFAPTKKDPYVVISYHGEWAEPFFQAGDSYSWHDPENSVTRTVVKGSLNGRGGRYVSRYGQEEHVVHHEGFFEYSEDMPTNGKPVKNGQRFLNSLTPYIEEPEPLSTGGSEPVLEETGAKREPREDLEEATGGDPEPLDLADAAVDLLLEGLNVIPLRPLTPKEKKPFLRPGELKDEPDGLFHRRSTTKDVREWQRRDLEARRREPETDWCWEGLAGVTGHTSGIFVVDQDDAEGSRLLRLLGITEELIKRTPSWTTGRGMQTAFRIPEGIDIPTMIKFLPGVDIKGEKGYAVVPPTVHYTGKRYEYITPFIDTPPADPPEPLINAIRLASGQGLSPTAYETLPEEIIEHIKGRGTKGSSSGSGGGVGAIDPLTDEIFEGHRDEVLFKRRACRYRYLGYEEDEIFKRVWSENQLYCPEPLDEEEVREKARKACAQYKKDDPALPEVLKIISEVRAYFKENPPKGMAEHTRWAMVEAFLEEALMHSSLIEDGIEVSISTGTWADKAGVSRRTLIRNKERLFEGGAFRVGKTPRGMKSGTIILIRSFYESCHHSTYKDLDIEDIDLEIENSKNHHHGKKGVTSHKTTTPDLHRRRWGSGRFGKTRARLLEIIEEVAMETGEDIITFKQVSEKLNEGVTDPQRMIKPTSLGYHFNKLWQDGILERVHGEDGKPIRGHYRLREDRYEQLGDLMRSTGEFKTVYKQRQRDKQRQEEYRRFLDDLEEKRGEEGRELVEMIDMVKESNQQKGVERRARL